MIRSLELRHWCQHEKLDLTFGAGLNGLLGPNGKGKSNILDALRFLDTGTSNNPGTLADNITWGHDTAIVRGEYAVGEYRFTLKRTVTKNKSTVQLKIKGGATFDKNAEVSAELDRIFGANKEARLNNVYIPQGELDAIIFAKPADRYDEFQKTFSMGNLQKAHEWLKIEVNGCALTPGLEEMLQQSVARFEAARITKDGLASQRLTLQAAVDQLAGCEAILVQAIEATRTQSALAYAAKQVAAATADVDVKQAEFTAAQLAEVQARSQVEAMREAAQAAELAVKNTETLVHSYTSGQGHRSLLAQRIAALSAMEPKPLPTERDLAANQLTEAQSEVHRLRAILANPPKLPQEIEAEEKARKVSAEIQALALHPSLPDVGKWEHELAAAKKHLVLVEQGKCPTCGSAFTHDPAAIKEQIASLAQQIKAATEAAALERESTLNRLRAEVAAANQVVEQLKTMGRTIITDAKMKAEASQTALTNELRRIDSLIQSHTALEQAIAEVKAVLTNSPSEAPDTSHLAAQKAFVAQFRAVELEIHGHVTKVAMANARCNAAVSALETANASLANLGAAVDAPSTEAVEKAKGDAELLSAKRRELNDVLQQIGINAALLQQNEAEFDRLRDKMVRESQLTKWVDQVKIARDALHVTALPSLAMREFARVLNVRMEGYLNLWEAPFRMWLDDDMAFLVEFEGQPACDAKRLSGGQKMFASTSFRLSMSDTFAASVGMLVLDEPAAYLDVDNVQHLQTLLLKLKVSSSQSGRQMLIVNHGEQLTGFLDHVIQL